MYRTFPIAEDGSDHLRPPGFGGGVCYLVRKSDNQSKLLGKKMKTYLAKTGEIKREPLLFDASEMPVGRLAVRIANALRGKDRPTYTPHIDTGAFVIVINADKAVFTGHKEERKLYATYTGHRSGYKETSVKEIREKDSTRLIASAVWGMMPHGRLGRAQFAKLKIYAGAEHPHAAQTPVKVTME